MAIIARTLNSGTEVDFDTETGRVIFRTCYWLVRVLTNHPEPDSFADTFRDVECGIRVHGTDDLCEGHMAEANRPFDDWHDIPVSPATDLSHVR